MLFLIIPDCEVKDGDQAVDVTFFVGFWEEGFAVRVLELKVQ